MLWKQLQQPLVNKPCISSCDEQSKHVGSTVQTSSNLIACSSSLFADEEMYRFRSVIHDEDISESGFNDYDSISYDDSMSYDGSHQQYTTGHCMDDNTNVNSGLQSSLLSNRIDLKNSFITSVMIKMNGTMYSYGVTLFEANSANSITSNTSDSQTLEETIIPIDMIPMIDCSQLSRVKITLPNFLLSLVQTQYQCNDLNICIEFKPNETFEVQLFCQQERVCILYEIHPLSKVKVVSEDGQSLNGLELSLMQCNLPISWPSEDNKLT